MATYKEEVKAHVKDLEGNATKRNMTLGDFYDEAFTWKFGDNDLYETVYPGSVDFEVFYYYPDEEATENEEGYAYSFIVDVDWSDADNKELEEFVQDATVFETEPDKIKAKLEYLRKSWLREMMLEKKVTGVEGEEIEG